MHNVSNDQRSGHGVGGGFDQTPGLAIGGEQHFNFEAQGIVAETSLADEGSPILGGAIERRLEQLIHLSPSLRLHRSLRPSASGAARLWPRAIRAARSARRCPSLRPF